MKKNIVATIVIASLLVVGTAFAGDRGAARETGMLYNGITYFDNGLAAACGEPAVKNESIKMFNGITAFDSAQQGTRAKCSPVGPLAKETTSRSYNGITLF